MRLRLRRGLFGETKGVLEVDDRYFDNAPESLLNEPWVGKKDEENNE